MDQQGRELPRAIESEKVVIACIVVHGQEAMKQVAHLLTKDDFYDRRHTFIWRAAMYLTQRDKDVDIVTLSEFLNTKERLEDIGGSAYLAEVTDTYIELQGLVRHAKIVADRAVARRIITAASQIIDDAATSDDIDTFVESAEKRLKGVTKTSARKQSKLAVVDVEEWRKIAREQSDFGSLRGISLGYYNLDSMTEGFEAGEVMILTGHTKHGKSKLAANIAWNVAQAGKHVMFINTEMTKLQVARRLNGMSRDETPTKGKIYVNDRGDLQYKDAISIMEHAKELGCALVIIDHLHFFGRSVDNQVNEISKITKEFKEAAVQLELPVLLLCHVSQGNTSKTPTLSDLKGSSSIAQDADIVITVWRDDRQNTSDPDTTYITRLAHRSAERSVTRGTLYADGIRLVEEKPMTEKERREMVDHAARMIGEKDDTNETHLETGWDEVNDDSGESVQPSLDNANVLPPGRDDNFKQS